eukprot:1985168-Rhodomonas_salina.1
MCIRDSLHPYLLPFLPPSSPPALPTSLPAPLFAAPLLRHARHALARSPSVVRAQAYSHTACHAMRGGGCEEGAMRGGEVECGCKRETDARGGAETEERGCGAEAETDDVAQRGKERGGVGLREEGGRCAGGGALLPPRHGLRPPSGLPLSLPLPLARSLFPQRARAVGSCRRAQSCWEESERRTRG